MTFQMRNFLPGEYQMVRDWANQVDWNQGFYDYLAFQKLDKQGFWMGVLDGQPVTTISVVQYDQNFAFIGLYITKPQYRGKGYGSKIWKKALQRITAKVVGLQGVIEQQLHYEKLGFKSYHKTITHSLYGTNRHHNSRYLVDCKQLDIEKLSAYDRKNFPSQRKEYLEKWISVPESKALAFVKDGNIGGYGVLRRSTKGFRVGPLCADSYEIARQIFYTLIGSISKNDKVLLDIPDINKDAMKLAQQFKMQPGFTCARMYTNQMPDIPFDKTVYGFASIQLG